MRHAGYVLGMNHRLWRRVAPALLAGVFLTTFLACGQGNNVLTNLAQVQALSLAEGAAGLPVKLRAVVTYSDPDWRMFFMHDAAGGVYLERTVRSEDPSWNLPMGEMVEIEGITSAGVVQCNVKEKTMQDLGMGRLPQPKWLRSDDSFGEAKDASWVKVSGVIVAARPRNAKLEMDLRINANRSVRVTALHGNGANAASLVGCTADVTGVFGLDLDNNKRPSGRNVLWLGDLTCIEHAAPLRTTPIADLGTSARRAPGQLARIRGNISSATPGEFFFAHDATGSVRVNYGQTPPTGLGGRIDLVGCPVAQGDTVILTDVSVIESVSASGEAASSASMAVPLAADTNLVTLTKTSQVRRLPATEAAKGYPVKIVGVVTYNDPTNNTQFVQDNSGGIYVSVARKKFDDFPSPPQRVEITGFTGPGDYAPVVEAEQLRVLGEGGFPKPLSATQQALMMGMEDSQWIAIEGVVRSQTNADNVTALSVATRDAVIEADVLSSTNHPAPRSYVDARVVIQGVCGTVFDNQRRLHGIKLYVPGWEQVIARSGEAEEAFALPVRPVSELLKFHGGIDGLHRSHVRGTVSATRLDGSFYLEDDTGAILAQPKPPVSVEPGEMVEVAGFPSVVSQFPALQEAGVRKLDQKSSLQPMRVAPETPLSPALHGALVRLQARVIERSSSSSQESLMLQFGPWITDAILNKESPQNRLGDIEVGSIVDLTGVYLARLDENENVQSFQVLLRSPQDARVVSSPSWWNARRALWVFAVIGTAFALVLAWVKGLQRQVHDRTRALRAEIEERKRMEEKVAQSHKELMVASRSAGMAEVATSVLHNVGNVLNSVNISANLINDAVKHSSLDGLGKVSALLQEHTSDLGAFFASEKGRQVPKYMDLLSERYRENQKQILAELESLRGNIDHINGIVARQQSYAKSVALTEVVAVTELVEDALRLNAGAAYLKVLRDYQAGLPAIEVDKHKVLQILVNLISNAKRACEKAGQAEKILTVRIARHENRIQVSLADNGVGIAAEDLTRIFSYGFTTREDGHGFGLHSGALAAKELGGRLTAHSDGPGKGAEFILELPLQPVAAAPSPRKASGRINVSPAALSPGIPATPGALEPAAKLA